jgi:hypothetical protein
MMQLDAMDWFECDVELPSEYIVFLSGLREHARSWPNSCVDTWAHRADEDSALIACLGIGATDEPLELLTVGVRLDGRSLRADRLHNQLFTLPDEPTSLSMAATGNVDLLAQQAADWFLTILRRPIVRWEWTRWGRVYANEYLFADTHEGLCQMYNKELAPRAVTRRLARSGHVSRNGWVDARGIGAPDRVVPVRGPSS